MKINESKKIKKELKKLPPAIQKKYNSFIKELSQLESVYHSNPKWEVKKMGYDKCVYRAKLNPWYRVAVYKNEDTGSLDVTKVSSREDFDYVGC